MKYNWQKEWPYKAGIYRFTFLWYLVQTCKNTNISRVTEITIKQLKYTLLLWRVKRVNVLIFY